MERGIRVNASIIVDVTNISRKLARESSTIQGLFLNDFFNTMDIEFARDKAEMQLCFLADELSADCIRSLRTLVEFCDMKKIKE